MGLALNIFSEQSITPQVLDVIRAAKTLALGDAPLDLLLVGPEDSQQTYFQAPVLVLGVGDGDVNTLSAKQLVTKESAVSDLAQAMRLAVDPQRQEEYDYRVIESLDELDSLGPVVITDIEVSGDIKVDMPWEVDIISIAFNDGNSILVVPEQLCIPSQKLKDILTSRSHVMHNGKFDAKFINSAFDIDIKPYADTMLMHFAMHHGAKSHGLKALAKQYFNAPEWEHEIKKYTKNSAHYENIPRPLLYQYNAGDVYWTGKFYTLFADQLENDPPRRELFYRLMKLSNMLQDIEERGVPIDVEFFTRLNEMLGEQAETLKETLVAMSGQDTFNPGSWQQVKNLLARLGVPVVSTNESTLTEAQRSLDKDSKAYTFIDTLLKYRGITKLKGTYAEGLLKRQRNGVLYNEYLLHGTTTGRLSSRNVNIQNIPRTEEGDTMPVRKGIATLDPDLVMIQVDYGQAELRTLAEITGDPNMIAAFQPGAPDYFNALMPRAYPDRFSSIEDYIEFSKAHKNEAKNLRAIVKGTQHGLDYGRGVPAIARALNLPLEEAQQLVQSIFDTYPGLKEWQDNVRRAVVDPDLSHYLITPFNRQFQYEVITERNRNAAENAALAFVPQSTANDICLDAALAVHQRIGKFDGRIIALIHDAIVVLVPAVHAEEVAKMMQIEMMGAAGKVFHRVPFATEATIGKNWDQL